MYSHINISYSIKLYAFTYNLLYLFKINAKAYNHGIANNKVEILKMAIT
ncbi:hypothetical protein FEDK69T_18880 [Flavobacterium enshiense DK69]|nr:hypothetical protein FEDK69T_18880 [Flavobacterium enshiense DK69]